MAWVATAVAGASLVGGYLSSSTQADAAQSAADSQSASSAAGIAEQRRQFDAIQQLLKPYADAGPGALTAQQNLLGLNGNAAQQQAINGIKSGSQFQELNKQGQDAILQNASATGGLRGGNVQGALAQFSPQLLQSLIQQQYSNLGGLTTLGQNSAAMTGNAGQNSATNISNLLQQQGAAQAGAALAAGKADAQMYNGIASSLGTFAGMGGFSGGYKGF